MLFLVIIFGLVVGSFLNAVIWRLHTGQSLFERHSRCPSCNHTLSWRDLIPLASFFMLKRRCRYCQKPISWQYPLVELATAIAFALAYSVQRLGHSEESVFHPLSANNYTLSLQLIFICFLLVIFVYDLKHYLILDKVVLPAAGLAFLYQWYEGNLENALLGALLLAGFFGLLFLISRGRWIGAGDIKLGIFLGLLVPYPATLALFMLAYVLGALVGLVLIILRNKKLSDRLPFGTFLTFAAFLAMLWGEEMIAWYFGLIGLR